MAFDLVTIDWNPKQTALWRYHVEKHCPGANIILLPQQPKLRELCWSCPKIAALWITPQNPGRFLYMDTDTIVFDDLEVLFDLMPEERHLGVTRYSTFPSCPRRNEGDFPKRGSYKLKYERHLEKFGLQEGQYRHYSTGMIVGRNFAMEQLADDWLDASRFFREEQVYKKHKLFEELSFSFLLSSFYSELVWEMPLWVHTNILNKHKEMVPEKAMVLHYHHTRRLARIGRSDLYRKGEENLGLEHLDESERKGI